MNLKLFKEAAACFGTVVKNKPKQIAGWEYLVKCLVANKQLDTALEQTEIAYMSTQGKTIFIFYRSAILYMMGKTNEGILQLEMALSKSSKLVNKLIKFYPEIMQDAKVAELIAQYKKSKLS